MYTVNITFKIAHKVLDSWIVWMKKEWIPMLVKNDEKVNYRINKLLGHDDEDGVTVVFQLSLPSRGYLNRYLELHQAAFHKDISEKWGEDVLFFQTLLEEI